MGGKRVKTYRRRLLDALFKTYRILQIQNPVLNIATVDVPGVIISIPWRPVSMDCTILVQSNVLYWSLYGNDFHIGVGSDVVCSTLIGSWKSLCSWNRQ